MPGPSRQLTVEGAAQWIDERCLTGPAARSVGLELELFPIQEPGGWHRPVPLARVQAEVEALGPLPCASVLTFEPGGQLELSTATGEDLTTAVAALRTDLHAVEAALSPVGIRLVALGADPVRPPRRLVDGPRYRAMETYFDHGGSTGRTMMCSTAAFQVNLGWGPPEGAGRRWAVAHAIGPAMVAAFANSRSLGGRPTAWRSARMGVWGALDETRTSPATGGYATYALAARVMLVRLDGQRFVPVTTPLSFADWIEHGHDLGHPTLDDLEYHLTTLFPPVRARGWMELRYLDALPDPWWEVAAAVVVALVDDEEAGAAARRAVDGVEDLWTEAAREGLHDPRLAAAAAGCFAAAVPVIAGHAGMGGSRTADLVAAYADRFVARGRCPADEGDENRDGGWGDDAIRSEAAGRPGGGSHPAADHPSDGPAPYRGRAWTRS